MTPKTFLTVLNPAFRLAGASQGLLSFEQVWSLPGVAVDATNKRRGGHSEVLRVEPDNGSRGTTYLKRQCNQLRRSLRSGLRAHPTYWFEKQFLSLANDLYNLGPEPLCYGESREPGQYRALLVVDALDNFCSLDELLQQPLEDEDRRACFVNLGIAIRRLHARRIEHGALYLKDIFAGPAPHRAIRLIDFERSRFRYSENAARRHDLERFFRRAPQLTPRDRANFEEGYGRHV